MKRRRRRFGLSFSQEYEDDYDDERGDMKTMQRLEPDPVLYFSFFNF